MNKIKNAAYLVMLAVTLSILYVSCRKTEIPETVSIEKAELKYVLNNKLQPEEFNDINWQNYREQVLPNQTKIFTLTFKTDKRKKNYRSKNY